MDLGAIQVQPRIRNAWQSIDLGFVLARTWWRPLFLSWLLPSMALWLLFSIVSWQQQWWVAIAVWWLKPLFDRLPLFFASRAMFGDFLTFRQLLQQWRRAIKFEWFSWLTIRRLSPTRSLDMPVTVLEQLSGQARSRRLKVMHQTSTSGGSWLTFVCVHIEVFFSLGVMALVALLIPAGVDLGLIDRYMEQEPWMVFISNGVSILAMALVAPFYTMAGFSLYIGRRVQLEGWDIEIRFRHLAERYQHQQNKLKTMAVS